MLIKYRNYGEKHLATSSACSKQQKIETQRIFNAAANKEDTEMTRS
jgi:hypothetical protein